jgi:hypothetical protein
VWKPDRGFCLAWLLLQVDVCLYFIAAHRLKLIDIKFMQAISTNVAIIPIIAKADSYVHWLIVRSLLAVRRL